MRIELLNNLEDPEFVNGKLVRLFDYDFTELAVFINFFQQLIENGIEFNTNQFESIKFKNCSIQFVLDKQNLGILEIDPEKLICKMNRSGYQNIIDKIDQQISYKSGHQWLDEFIDEPQIEFLLSQGGGW